MDGEKNQTSTLPRRVTHLGFVGSTAVADCAVELFYGSMYIGRFYNTTAGASKVPLANSDLIPIGGPLICRENDPLRLIVVDIPDTQNVAFTIVIQEIPMAQQGGFRRRY